MRHRHLQLTASLTAAWGIALMCGPAGAALNLEGQSGVFLNPLAYTADKGSVEVSAHRVSLDSLGSVSTWSLSTGLTSDVEVGATRVTSSVDGVSDQTILHAKWLFQKETDSSPAIAAWAIRRDLSDGGESTDLGVSATKILKLAKKTTIVDLGVRSTKARGLGLFGFDDSRKLKVEGSVAVFVTDKLIVGAEFKEHVGQPTWKDLAVRYVASSHLNLDAGIADLGPGLGNQVALAATWR